MCMVQLYGFQAGKQMQKPWSAVSLLCLMRSLRREELSMLQRTELPVDVKFRSQFSLIFLFSLNRGLGS